MGVQDFSPKIRPSLKSTNTNLDELIKNASSPQDTWIGIDMSILLVSISKSNTNICEQLFSRPICPIPSLNQKIIDKLQVYIDCSVTVVCVFDGLPGQLKKNHAHRSRYGNNVELKNELKELYSVSSFECHEDECKNVKRVKEIRKKLASVNRSDLLFEIMESLKTRFKERVIFIGSPFEADHQLASLFKQEIIDYVFTNDSDLSVLGTDVILNTRSDKKCFVSRFSKLLNTQLPSSIGPQGIPWNEEVLHHVACFLGNDFIRRNPGNSVSKLEEFVKAITNSDGSLKNEKDVFDYIFQTALIPTNCTREDKDKWTSDAKILHIKLWKEAMPMFKHGPAFLVFPTHESVPLRDSIVSGEFTVKLGSMAGDIDIDWVLPNTIHTHYDVVCGRTHLVGFNPHDDVKDALAMRDELKSPDNRDIYEDLLFKKIFQLEVSIKNAKDIAPLSRIVDETGRELFHGSILNFEEVPIRYYSKEALDFWLSSRQIKSPATLQEIKCLVRVIWEMLGPTLQPIAKELMRGCSGYCSPEILVPSTLCKSVAYLEGENVLKIIRKSFPILDDNKFTEMFGKRNGTRKRCIMHVEGGSFDINQIKITKDLIHKDFPDDNILVCSAGCSPSQKLKDNNKNKFYEMRIVIKMNENWEFERFLPHPATNCDCPNGCILCAHLGAFYLIINALRKYDIGNESSDATTTYTSFESIRNKFPEPINNLLSKPMISTYAFPQNNSKKKQDQKIYRQAHQKNGKYKPQKKSKNRKKSKSKKKANQSRRSNTKDVQDSDGETGEQEPVSNRPSSIQNLGSANGIFLGSEHSDLIEYALEGILDATDEPTNTVVLRIDEWLVDIKNARDTRGAELKSIKGIDDSLVAAAKYRESDLYLAKQTKIFTKMEELCSEFNFMKIKKGDDKSDSGSDDSDMSDISHDKIRQPEPIVLPVIKAVAHNVNEEVQRLSRKYDYDKIRLDLIASEIHENEVTTSSQRQDPRDDDAESDNDVEHSDDSSHHEDPHRCASGQLCRCPWVPVKSATTSSHTCAACKKDVHSFCFGLNTEGGQCKCASCVEPKKVCDYSMMFTCPSRKYYMHHLA
jgi:hypothetical protein